VTVDRTRLALAIVVFEKDKFLIGTEENQNRLCDALDVIVPAARAVVEAPEIWRCDKHRRDASLIPNGEIWCATGIDGADRCSVTRVFLVPAEEES
jgi:hypothetical protein